jgi:tetratricopeptide (TPR) repeat protein
MRHIAIALATAFVAFSALAATDTQLIADGRAAQQRGDAEQAAKLFEQAVAHEAERRQVSLSSAEAYGRQAQKAGMFGGIGLAKKAKAEMEKRVAARSELPRRALRPHRLSYIAPGIVGGGEDKALAQAAEIRSATRSTGTAPTAASTSRRRRADLARKEYVEAVREQPNSPKTHYYLGNFLVNEKDWPGALHEYDYALKLDPNYMPAYFRIGHHAAARNRTTRAARSRCASTSPTNRRMMSRVTPARGTGWG